MQEKSWIMLRVLMNRYHEGAADTLLEGMIQEDQQMVLNQSVQSGEAIHALSQPADHLSEIHYSWLAPKLQDLPKSLISLVLAALPESHTNKLKTLLKVEPAELTTLSPPMKTFFLNRLYPKFELKEVLPIAYLPETSFSPLANLSKSELVELIDFLGLYDLAEEVKRIVDKERLKQIYETLTKKKHDFLRKIIHQKEKLVTTKLNLEYWDGDHNKLNKLLHYRGIVRLGYALSGQHPDFIWHLVHRLDIGRGKKVMEYYNREEIPGVSGAIAQQVRNVLENFKKV